MWLWIFRILCTAALLYCFLNHIRLLEQARNHTVRPVQEDELRWDLTDKLFTQEGKILAGESRLWAIPALTALIVLHLIRFLL